MRPRDDMTLLNGRAVAREEVPVLPFDEFAQRLRERLLHEDGRLSALFGVPHVDRRLRLHAVTNDARVGRFAVIASDVGDRYPSLTPEMPEAHWFEREIAEQWGVVPEGHPWLKPVRFHRSYVEGRDAWGRTADDPIFPGVQPKSTDYFKVRGDQVHEVAVGPVHAGVIEPGHFRFQCHGETVFSLEIELGYQHRGVERQLLGGPNHRSLHYCETLAGDTSVGHANAHCQALEGLAGIEAPLRAQAIRGIALELERLANHTGDLGALAQDVGFLPTSAFCGRLRGDFLNTTALLCGNRFGRSLLRPGGVRFDVDRAMVDEIRERTARAARDVAGAADLLWNTPTVMERFEGCGTVPRHVAVELGLVGLVARASGVDRDARRDFPSGIYRFHQVPVSTGHTGDVFARAYTRGLEIHRSVRFVDEQLRSLPATPIRREVPPLRANALVVSVIEGWRGEICHVALTDHAGRFAHYKVVDPSFHNWIGLAMALRDQGISDFPVNNKSFNLSYCGHDL